MRGTTRPREGSKTRWCMKVSLAMRNRYKYRSKPPTGGSLPLILCTCTTISARLCRRSNL